MWRREASRRWKRKQWQRGNAARAPKSATSAFSRCEMRCPQLHATQSLSHSSGNIPLMMSQGKKWGEKKSYWHFLFIYAQHLPIIGSSIRGYSWNHTDVENCCKLWLLNHIELLAPVLNISSVRHHNSWGNNHWCGFSSVSIHTLYIYCNWFIHSCSWPWVSLLGLLNEMFLKSV